MEKEIQEKIEKFITDNKLDFTDDAGSGLNGNLTTLCGYSLYLGVDRFDELADVVHTDINWAAFNRTFHYARKKNYGDWWENENNRKKYKI